MKHYTFDDLKNKILVLHHKSYKAYKSLKGEYAHPYFNLVIDHVQGDPFADPSRLRLFIQQEHLNLKPTWFQTPARQLGLEDFFLRQFDHAARKYSHVCGSGKSGIIAIDRPGQQILKRTAVMIQKNALEIRFVVGLPAEGRKILADNAVKILTEFIPQIVEDALFHSVAHEQEVITNWVETCEDTEALRQQLYDHDLVAFIANGAQLARRSGIDDRPLNKDHILFESPPSLAMELKRPNGGPIRGLGIPRGIHLIVGGGYHGKSTLMRALQLGVYNHIPGDGREYVVSIAETVKVRAEDGRSVAGVDISPFINNLPQKVATHHFYTANASGSTSQASSIMEALEIGAQCLLIDEDTSATNFMIRDQRMQELIEAPFEPITPFSEKIVSLYKDHGVSSIIVMGGSGEYLDKAHRVLGMFAYRPRDLTQKAHDIAQRYKSRNSTPENKEAPFGAIKHRVPQASSLNPSRGRKKVHVKVRDHHEIYFGTSVISISALEQLVTPSQLRAIGLTLAQFYQWQLMQPRPLLKLVRQWEAFIDQHGLDGLQNKPFGDLALPRRFELAAALNRLRCLKVQKP